MSIKDLSYFSQLTVFIVLLFTSSFAQTKFAVIGDFGDDNEDEQAVADLVNSWNVDFIITTGDNSYGSTPIDDNIGKYFANWIGNYVGAYGIGSQTNKFFPSLGNHDYSDGDGVNAYLDYFTLPGISGNSSGNEKYYDYVIDNVHFFVIDSETDLTVQQSWLESQMINCEQNHSHWKIVYFHRPPYSSGQHGSSSSMRWDFLQWGADAVLSGHDHNYERLVVDGMTYFVNGSGGRSIRDFGTILTDYSVVRYNGDFGAMLMEATDSTLTAKFYNTSGVLLDSWSRGDTTLSVNVTVPNGGQKWTRGLDHQINWYDTFLEDVKIDLYKGGILHSEINPSTSSDGTTNWVIPDSTSIGSNYRIKISKVNDISAFDFSDEDFSIASFEITSPNGGENWEIGSFQQIKWNDAIPDGDMVVDFELWKGGTFEREIFVNERADGSKDWDIPTDLESGSDYRIKIIHSNDSTDFDFSDADFSISSSVASLIVVAPNRDENWQAGTQQSIIWNDNIAENVMIELFKGGFLDSVITISTPSDGSFIWDRPANTVLDSDYTIKLTSVSDPGLFDYSDNYFTISQTIMPNDFTVDFLLQDNCSNSNILTFGTNSDATDCFDSTYDILAPPQPQSTEYDSRFKTCGDDLIKDIRATNTDGSLIWDVYYQPETGCDPVSFSWSINEFPPQGNFYLVDPNGGSLVNVNMRQDSTYTDALGLNHLQILFNYNNVINIDINNGWNMISLPLVVEDNYYKTLFPNAINGTLFGFNGSYYGSDTIKAEKGYWLKFNAPEVVNIEGTEISLMDLELAQGWNMIGGPACDLPFSSVVDPGGIIIPGTLFGINGTYFSTNTFIKGIGYWIKTKSPGIISLDCPAALNNAKLYEGEAILGELDEFSTIDLEDNKGNHQKLYFDGKLEENIDIESYSLPPLPLSGLFDTRIPGGYRLSESDEVEIEIQSESYPLRIKITGKNNGIINGYLVKEYVGNVEVGEREIPDGMELMISNTNVKLVKIKKGSVIPSKFALEQNYPNPFNPSTRIKYVLPVKANVKLKIINSLGQEISTLVNGEIQAGVHEVEFDASNLASGIYFYRIQVVNPSSSSGDIFVETGKMVLLR